MSKVLIAASVAVFAFALSLDGASAASKGQGRQISGTPSHASTMGMDARASVANRRGANNPRFCPPGQKKKGGQR